MIVVYKQGQALQDMTALFNVNNPTELPFVDSTLGNISVSGWRAFSETTKFFIPKNWSHLDDGTGSFVVYEDISSIPLGIEDVVVFTDVNILPISLPGTYDLEYKRIFKKGELSLGKGFKSMKDFLVCKDTQEVDTIEYLEYTMRSLSDTILISTGASISFTGGGKIVSGPALIDPDSELIGRGNRVFGPCIIMNSNLTNTTVYPGSVIINSNIVDSTVDGSYIHNCGISASNLISTLAYASVIDNVNIENSLVPRNSQLNGKK